MKNLQELLKDADPLVNEPPLSDFDAQRMRRVVMAADHGAAASFSAWKVARWAALAAVVMTVVVVGLDRWPAQTQQTDAVTNEPAEQAPSHRQVQFVTAGGTRIIWTFNSDFELPGGNNR